MLCALLLCAGVFFFHRSARFLVDQDYLGGLLYIFVGLSSIRYGVEMARLAVLTRFRS